MIAILLLVWRTSSLSSFLYPTGMILLSLATAAVMAAVVNPSSTLGEVLGCRPMRWIGVRSYGIYLWHWPIIVLWGSPHTGVNWPQAILQVAVSFIVAALSWRFVEEPIRQGAFGRLRQRSRSRVAVTRARHRVMAISATAVIVLSLVVVGLAGALPVLSNGHNSPAKISQLPPKLSNSAGSSDPATSSPAAKKLAPATKTSCRSVVYIGDSTSEGETSTNYIPNPPSACRRSFARWASRPCIRRSRAPGRSSRPTRASPMPPRSPATTSTAATTAAGSWRSGPTTSPTPSPRR